MLRDKHNYPSLRFTIFTATFLVFVDHVSAENINTSAFCSNTCKAPHCDSITIKADCKKKCVPTWQSVAKLELSTTSSAYRSQKDQKIKDSMLYESQIAKCLDIQNPDKKELVEEKKEPITEQMVLDSANVWKEKGKPDDTVADLARLLKDYSEEKKLGWSDDVCKRLAGHLIDLEPLN